MVLPGSLQPWAAGVSCGVGLWKMKVMEPTRRFVGWRELPAARLSPILIAARPSAACAVPGCAWQCRGIAAGQPRPCTGLGHVAPFLTQACPEGSK